MRAIWLAGALAMLATAGCGSSEPETEKPPIKVEDTVFGDMVGTQDRARDRTNAAVESHKAAMEAQIRESEDTKPQE
jgi:predicted component of type VI protein secretion system